MTRVAVEGTMLSWARERAGRTRESLTPKFARLTEWETGEAQPTLKQLEAFANAVHVDECEVDGKRRRRACSRRLWR
jgi:hypothetical protein